MGKNISYLNKNFSEFKKSLVDFSKTYFPNSYSDFSESSPGNMFLEMASYVGDVLSFYTDSQIQENFLNTAQEKSNLLNMAYSLGYRPKLSYSSTTTVDFYQKIPAIISGSNYYPNLEYALIIPENTVLESSISGVKFITTDLVDFSSTSSVDISLYDSENYLFKKSVNVISAEIKDVSFTFGSPEKFPSVEINDPNFINILHVSGSDGSVWHEVPYIAQSFVINRIPNTGIDKGEVPYIFSTIETPNRFVTRIKGNNKIEIQFGSGMYYNESDENIIPNPNNIMLGKIPSSDIADLLNNYNKASIYYTKQYGVAPSNITLNVKYLSGGGVSSNVDSNEINNILPSNNIQAVNSSYTSISLQSLICNNPIPAIGGREGDSIEEIRLNTLNSFSSQLRAVTKDDYINKSLSLPPYYGNISKAYIEADDSENIYSALSLYVLSYSNNRNLSEASTTLKNNLKNYLELFKSTSDKISIKDAHIINIGVNFSISIIPGFNGNQILSECVSSLINYFSIDKWKINQPILINDIISTLLKVKGVQYVNNVTLVNKYDGNYSKWKYDIEGATMNNVLYPPKDISIFEVKFPENDIQGRITTT